MNWLTDSREGVVFNLKIVPRASRNEISGPMGDTLKVRLQAPPVEGKANEALVRFLAETLGVRDGDVRILSGESGRTKRVLVKGLSASAAAARIGR